MNFCTSRLQLRYLPAMLKKELFAIIITIIIINTISIEISPTKASSNIIYTPLGIIRGKTVHHGGSRVKAYLGIPYAKPPVGKLRFKKPQPIEPWNATLQATTLPPGCVQYASDPFPWKDDPPGLSMDCLYLNIWTPLINAKSKKKPVMFWLYGGGFVIGSARLDFYDGRVLAAIGDVIVVTMNYRLGAEGFFYSGTQDAPGNMGLWDMVEALKWVRNNIEYFGGDKHSITLFGQSSGAIAIGMFCTSPVTRGMFKRIIMQSGSPTNLDGKDNEKTSRISWQLAKSVGCTSCEINTLQWQQHTQNMVNCMRCKNPFDLAVVLANITAKFLRGYYPRFGDELLPKDPRLAVIDGDFDPIDVLIGTNSGDGANLIAKTMKDVFGFFGEKDPQINLTFGGSIIREKFKDYPHPNSVVKQYLENVEPDDYETIREQVFTAQGDYSRTCPSVYFAERFGDVSANVYYYYFTHIPSNSPWAPWMLAVHFDETPFVFGYPLRYPENYTEAEQHFSRRLVKAWSRFAKTGIFKLGDLPSYTKENPYYEVLDLTTSIISGEPHEENCEFFRSEFGF